MSLRSDLVSAALTAGFSTAKETSPREIQGLALPALFVHDETGRDHTHSVSVSVAQEHVQVVVMVVTPQSSDAGAYGGADGAELAMGLARTTLAAVECRLLSWRRSHGPWSGRDVFVTALLADTYVPHFPA